MYHSVSKSHFIYLNGFSIIIIEETFENSGILKPLKLNCDPLFAYNMLQCLYIWIHTTLNDKETYNHLQINVFCIEFEIICFLYLFFLEHNKVSFYWLQKILRIASHGKESISTQWRRQYFSNVSTLYRLIQRKAVDTYIQDFLCFNYLDMTTLLIYVIHLYRLSLYV